jgi:hypothetical protein
LYRKKENSKGQWSNHFKLRISNPGKNIHPKMDKNLFKAPDLLATEGASFLFSPSNWVISDRFSNYAGSALYFVGLVTGFYSVLLTVIIIYNYQANPRSLALSHALKLNLMATFLSISAQFFLSWVIKFLKEDTSPRPARIFTDTFLHYNTLFRSEQGYELKKHAFIAAFIWILFTSTSFGTFMCFFTIFVIIRHFRSRR